MPLVVDEDVDSEMQANYASSSSSSPSSTAALKGTGNEWTALGHIVTAVIGSGVLSLARSMAQLGWIADPLPMLSFGCVTLTSAFLPATAIYLLIHILALNLIIGMPLTLMLFSILGETNAWFCGIIVRINFIKVAIVYTITSAISIRYLSNLFSTEQSRNQTAIMIKGMRLPVDMEVQDIWLYLD